MDCKTLQKLVENPHFKMSEKQLQALEKCKNSGIVKHSTQPMVHSGLIVKHDPKPQEEDRG